jgi:DNA-binding transcriptional ArsR family regulator
MRHSKRQTIDPQLPLRALAEPRRREILELLRSGPRSVTDIADDVDVTQQAVSQHLRVLEEAGLVDARREGTRHVYAVRAEGFAPVEAFVRGFWDTKLDALDAATRRKKS